MTQRQTEQTTAGIAGKLLGKAKELAGALTGNEDLRREGFLQQAQGEADAAATALEDEARQEEAEAGVAARRAATEAERERLAAEVGEADQRAEVEAQEVEAVKDADVREQRAALEAAADRSDAEDLERRAEATSARADAVDPKETP